MNWLYPIVYRWPITSALVVVLLIFLMIRWAGR